MKSSLLLARLGAVFLFVTPLSACAKGPVPKNDTGAGAASQPAASKSAGASSDAKDDGGLYAVLPPVPEGHEVAILAGGCFWCVESDLEPIPGIQAVVSGYIGGKTERPTYRQVSSRTSGHAEAVWVLFDPKVISYAALLDAFWVRIDPTTADRQFCDVGDEYRPEIFVVDAAQRKTAEASKAALEKEKPFSDPIVVAISDAGTFWPAENYHQDFYRTTPGRYYSYRQGCGRDRRLQQLWGDKAPHAKH